MRTQQFVAVTSSRIMPETEKTVIIKGGLISESFSRLLQSSKKCANHYLEHLLFTFLKINKNVGPNKSVGRVSKFNKSVGGE